MEIRPQLQGEAKASLSSSKTGSMSAALDNHFRGDWNLPVEKEMVKGRASEREI